MVEHMEMQNSTHFLDYYRKVKGRTRRLLPLLPEDRLEWRYRAGVFSPGDIVRHLALLERWMFAENVQFRPSQYSGCGVEYAEGAEAVEQLYVSLGDESEKIFANLSDADLQRKCQTPAGIEIRLWKWLRAMIEHEAHHRGQLYMYLSLLEIPSPPLYGLTSEQVADSRKNN